MRARPYRVTIAGLLSMVVVAALGLTALRFPSWLWANLFFTVAIVTLSAATLTAIEQRGARRSFWRGFAICGWCYFLLTSAPVLSSHLGFKLVTTTFLDLLYPRIAPAPVGASWGPAVGVFMDVSLAPGGSPGSRSNPVALSWAAPTAPGAVSWGMPTATADNRWSAWSAPDRTMTAWGTAIPTGPVTSPEAFRQIGHSMFCLLFAMFGGLYARRLRARDEQLDT